LKNKKIKLERKSSKKKKGQKKHKTKNTRPIRNLRRLIKHSTKRHDKRHINYKR
jgi:hypothetical protein